MAALINHGVRRLAMAVAVTVIAAAGGVAAAADARTGAYPTRPVRFIVAQSAGGNADFVAVVMLNAFRFVMILSKELT